MKKRTARFLLFMAFVLSMPHGVASDRDDETPSIVYAFGEWRPVVYQDTDGENKGLFVEIFREVFEKELGWTLGFSYRPWKRAQHEVATGTADFMITIPTEERLTYAIPSEQPFFESFLHVYTYKGHPKLAEIRNIKSVYDIKRLDLTPVTNIGNGWHKKNIDAFGINTHYVPSDEIIAKVLAHRRQHDIMIDAVVPMNYLIQKHQLADQLVLTDARFGPLKFFVMVSKKSKFADQMPAINDAFARLKANGDIDRLLKKYSLLTSE